MPSLFLAGIFVCYSYHASCLVDVIVVSSRHFCSLVFVHIYPSAAHLIRVARTHTPLFLVRIIRAFLIEEQKIVKKIGQAKARKA